MLFLNIHIPRIIHQTRLVHLLHQTKFSRFLLETNTKRGRAIDCFGQVFGNVTRHVTYPKNEMANFNHENHNTWPKKFFYLTATIYLNYLFNTEI